MKKIAKATEAVIEVFSTKLDAKTLVLNTTTETPALSIIEAIMPLDLEIKEESDVLSLIEEMKSLVLRAVEAIEVFSRTLDIKLLPTTITLKTPIISLIEAISPLVL